MSEQERKDGIDWPNMNEFTWDMKGYIQEVGFLSEDMQITKRIANNIFQLDPPPPELGEEAKDNDYILETLRRKDLKWFSYFLHKYEPRLNAYIRKTLAGDDALRYDPEQFLDIKMSCVLTMLRLLPAYDMDRGAAFTTFIHDEVRDAIREYQRGNESWSFSSLSQYKKIRTAAWMQRNLQNAAEAFAQKENVSLATAKQFLAESKAVHNRDSLYVKTEEGNETLEEIQEGVSYDYIEILLHGIHAKAVRNAFYWLSAQEQHYLEARNVICMECGRAEPLSDRPTFDELGETFELKTANGAEKAYRRAVEHLALLMAEDNAIRVVTIRRKSVTKYKKKIAVAAYEYQADGDGEWGEIHFDFEAEKAEVTYVAELDTTRSHVYAQKAIEVIFDAVKTELPKEKLVAFPRY